MATMGYAVPRRWPSPCPKAHPAQGAALHRLDPLGAHPHVHTYFCIRQRDHLPVGGQCLSKLVTALDDLWNKRPG
jgi:hypothetical protein